VSSLYNIGQPHGRALQLRRQVSHPHPRGRLLLTLYQIVTAERSARFSARHKPSFDTGEVCVTGLLPYKFL
jgi:hypothetical protein